MDNVGLNFNKSVKTSDSESKITSHGGIKKTSVNQNFYSIFDKADRDKNGILDDSEMSALRNELDANKDGDIDKKEAKSYIKNNNLTYTDEKGKQKELSKEDLNQFLADLGKESENVKCATKGEVDGKSAVTITRNDGTQEIIFDDKDNPSRLISTNPETGETKTQFIKENKLIKEKTESSNGDVTTTELGEDGKPTKSTSEEKESGVKTVTNYTDGIETSKEVINGNSTKHYSINDGKEILETETQDLGGGILKTSTHKYEGNREIITINDPSNGTTIQIKEDGKLIAEEEKSLFTGKTITQYADDGSKAITNTQNGKITKTLLTPDGHKAGESITKDGKRYIAKFDGEGHGGMVLKFGENLHAFSKRTGIPMSEITKYDTNNKAKVGDEIMVDEKYIKADDPNYYGVSSKIEIGKHQAYQAKKAEERARAEAEIRANNQKLANLNQVFVQTGTKGKYKSYTEYAEKLLKNEGISPITKDMVNKTATRISQMNDNKPIQNLSSIKCPVSQNYKDKLEGVVRNGISANNKKYTTEAKKISQNLHECMDDWVLDGEKMRDILKEVNYENAAEVVLNYKRYSGGEGICTSMMSKKLFGLKDCCKDEVRILELKMYNRALGLGLNVEELHKDFNKFISTKNFPDQYTTATVDKILTEMAATITNDTNMTASEKYDAHKNSVATSKQTLQANHKYSANLLKIRHDKEGWAGKIADSFGKITGYGNTYKEVKSDIDQYERDIAYINSAKTESEYKQRFKAKFGIDYNPEKIMAYEKTEKQFAKIEASKKALTYFDNNALKICKYNGEKVSKEDVKRAINTLMMVSGVPNTAEHRYLYIDEVVERKFESIYKGKKWENATPEEKYRVLSEIAKAQRSSLQSQLNKNLNGRTYESWKEDYQGSFARAYGTANKHAAKVAEYIHSQEVGEETVLAITTTLAAAAGMALGPGVAALLGGSAEFIGRSSNKISSGQNYTIDDFHKDAHKGVVTGELLYAGSRAGNYVGSKIVSSMEDGVTRSSIEWLTSDTVDNIVENAPEAVDNTVRDISIDVGVDGFSATTKKGYHRVISFFKKV